jgi:hypothetical protein
MGDCYLPRMGFPFLSKNVGEVEILIGCILKMLPLEYRLVEGVITTRMGKVLGKDPNNHK